MAADDFELLQRWRNGDKQAGDALLGRHFPSIFLFFNSKLPDRADDLAQQVFLACVEARDRIDDRSSFRAYLFGIARRRLADHFRRYHRKDARTDFADTSIVDLVSGTPSRAVLLKQEQALLLEAMRQIPIDFQITLELFYWEEMSLAEIADVLGVAVGTVKSRLNRAKERLRERIDAMEAPAELREQTMTGLETWAVRLRDSLRRDED